MIRALTIRFGIMCVGAVPLVAALNSIEPEPGLVMASVMIYELIGSVVIGRYCLKHEDEIPTRTQRRSNRHR